MVLSLLQQSLQQPTRRADVFSAPRATPINNPFLAGYWDTYAPQEAAFELPPSNYPSFAWSGDPPPASPSAPSPSGPTSGVEGGISGNEDVYAPRANLEGEGSPSAPGNYNDTVAPPAQPNLFNFDLPNPVADYLSYTGYTTDDDDKESEEAPSSSGLLGNLYSGPMTSLTPEMEEAYGWDLASKGLGLAGLGLSTGMGLLGVPAGMISRAKANAAFPNQPAIGFLQDIMLPDFIMSPFEIHAKNQAAANKKARAKLAGFAADEEAAALSFLASEAAKDKNKPSVIPQGFTSVSVTPEPAPTAPTTTAPAAPTQTLGYPGNIMAALSRAAELAKSTPHMTQDDAKSVAQQQFNEAMSAARSYGFDNLPGLDPNLAALVAGYQADAQAAEQEGIFGGSQAIGGFHGTGEGPGHGDIGTTAAQGYGLGWGGGHH